MPSDQKTNWTEVRSESFGLVLHGQHICANSVVCQNVAPPGECNYNAVLCCDCCFSWLSVVLHAFSAVCMYSTFGHHPHPLDYLCAKFRFFRRLHCWDSPWRKLAYSPNQSINHSPSLFDCTKNRSFCFREFNHKTFYSTITHKLWINLITHGQTVKQHDHTWQQSLSYLKTWNSFWKKLFVGRLVHRSIFSVY